MGIADEEGAEICCFCASRRTWIGEREDSWMDERIQKIPEVFLNRMREMLGEEFEEFLESYGEERVYGLRVNEGKISCREFEEIVPFEIEKIPWISNGYFYKEESRPSRCPFYQAGLYYLQEPSAMTPAECLPVKPGEYILDLCAAPGGKATALGAKLKGQGILVANDISASRARALLRNIELFGIPNVCVLSEPPEKLRKVFSGYFHKILLDAPCSGEGMFRKEEALAKDWSPEKSENLSQIQKELILTAWDMLRPGGMLLYSTCTFAPCEDEEVISCLLSQHPEAEVVPLPDYEGFSPGVPAWGKGEEALSRCVRIFPHKMKGEGHFMALLRKPGDSLIEPPVSRREASKDTRKWLEIFFQEIGLASLGGQPFDWSRVETRGDRVYYLPPVDLPLRGLNFLRNGLYLGDLKKNRFEPSQPLALAIRKGEAKTVISLFLGDKRLERYLKGETLEIAPSEASSSKGWHLLCAEGYPLGFGKLVNHIFKNKYPAGWRA